MYFIHGNCGSGNLASAISLIIVVVTIVILLAQKKWVARRNYIMSALRPPKEEEVHGMKRVLVTLPVAIVAFASFLPQLVNSD